MDHTGSDSTYMEESTRASLGTMNRTSLNGGSVSYLNGTASFLNGHSHTMNGTSYQSYANGEDEELEEEEDDEEEITPAELIEKLQQVQAIYFSFCVIHFH
jgi:hypothetical protein